MGNQRRLLGGGMINGSFLAAALVDELSIMIAPLVDGLSCTTATFEHRHADLLAKQFSLKTVEQLPDGIIHLRYGR
jgi:riboflavin biosynthesis pyrimidine reductase